MFFEDLQNNLLIEIIRAALLLIAFVLPGWLFVFIIKKMQNKWPERKEHSPVVLSYLFILRWPIFILLAVQGAIVALRSMSFTENWHDTLNKSSIVTLIVIGTYVVAKVFSYFLGRRLGIASAQKKIYIDEGTIRFIHRITVSLLCTGGILLLLDYLGIPISPLLAGLGIGGLAIALALQPTLGNFFAGSQIITDQIVRVGDYIELDNGAKGYVVDIGWRSTRIRTTFNNLVIIPNSRLADSIITNYYSPHMELAITVDGGVSYSSDLQHVENVAMEVANEVIEELPEAVKERGAWFGYEAFDDSNIKFWIWIYAKDRLSSFTVKTELIKRLHTRFRKEGIKINYPVREIIEYTDTAKTMEHGNAGEEVT